MLNTKCVLRLLVLLSAVNACGYGQVAVGTYQYGAFDSLGADTINIGNLNVMFSAPVLNKPGRAGTNFTYTLFYNGSIWTPTTVGGTTTWVPDQNWGWSGQTQILSGFVSYNEINSSCIIGGRHFPEAILNNYAYHDAMGIIHRFTGTEYAGACSGYTSTPFPLHVKDNSGLLLNSVLSITTPKGTTFDPPDLAETGAGSYEDTNGNVISTSGSGNFTDTVGVTALAISGTAPSPQVMTYTDTAGHAQTVTISYVSYTVQTNFGCGSVNEYGPLTDYLVDRITYADGTYYKFTYEATPGASGNVTGRVASITLPEGGAIDYSYGGGSSGHIECGDGSAAAITRGMPNDPLSPSRTYTRTSSTHTEVVDGLSNYAEYDFVSDATDTYHTPYLINHKQYQGAATGTPLVSDQSCLNGATPDCTTQSLTLPITSISKTTALGILGSSTEKQSVLAIGSYGLLSEDKEYDFGSGSPGPLLSDTLYTYASLGNGIVSDLASVETKDGSGHAIQNVTYAYDAGTLTTTSGLPQHDSISGSRGNLTSVTYSIVLGGSSISPAYYTYDDAGEILTSKDMHLNTTTYTYDSSSDTYLTGTTFPTTGSVAHTTSSTYDPTSGMKLTDVDQNGNTTTYTYDTMLRLSSASYPGTYGAYISYAYSLGPTSPYTSVSTLHSGSSYITAKTSLDAYGRLERNRHYGHTQR